MIKLNVRVDEALHERLCRSADFANISLSALIRAALGRAVDSASPYRVDTAEETLAHVLTLLALVSAMSEAQCPAAFRTGLDQARAILRDRGLDQSGVVQ